MIQLYTFTEVTKLLRRKPRWLLQWLREHPVDANGRCYYRMAGKSRRFTGDDIVRLLDDTLKWEEAGRTMPTGGGTVYFIQCHDLIKIGFTRSWRARLIKMGTDMPGEPIILHTEPGTFADEAALHRTFADLRHRGEWFRKAPELLMYIDQRKDHLANG